MLTTKAQFLSGDIYSKLEEAIARSQEDASFNREVEILEQNLPKAIPLSQIIIKLGATWIPISYYEQFCLEVIGLKVKLFYSATTHTWDIRGGKPTGHDNRRWGWTIEAWEHEYYRVNTFPALNKKMNTGLFTLALNQAVPEVKVVPSKGEKSQVEVNFTRQAIARQNQLKRKFASWCREDSQRAEELERIYNQNFNRTALCDWQGEGVRYLHRDRSDVLRQSGMGEEWADKLRNYQLDAIWRFVLQGGLIGLEVGLGKTAIAIAVVMLRKYYGFNNKSLIVVQRSTLNQFYNTCLEMYPDARVLAVEPEDFNLDLKQNTLAKIAYCDWDLILLTHDSFEGIPVGNDTQLARLRSQLKTTKKEISRLHEVGESSLKIGNTRGNEILKTLGNLKSKLTSQIEAIVSDKFSYPLGIVWEDLGIDLAIVDEIQRYKNYGVSTSLTRKVAGLSIKPSARAMDFDLKAYWLRQEHGAKALIGMTGTVEPTNSVVGIYVFQRYFQPEELERKGITHFDAWVANFGEIKSQPEPKLNGRWYIVERLTDFINMAELAQLWFSCVHYLRYETVKDDFVTDQRRPEPEFITVTNQMSVFQKEMMVEIGDRYERLKAGHPRIFPSLDEEGYLLNGLGDRLIHPGTSKFLREKELATAIELELDVEATVDNFLLLSGDSRKLMLAPQLLDSKLPVEDESKLVEVAERVLTDYRATTEDKLTQLIFLDFGTPGGSSKFDLYNYLKQYWVEREVPAAEIAFIQDYKSLDERQELFERFNQGEVRILLSSTESGGIGVNVQERLYAIHNFCFPYRPDQLEQRQGRGLRMGNRNQTIKIYRYITEGSNGVHGADTVILQFLQNKQQLRDRFTSGDPTLRRLSENDNAAQLYMMLKAESTGDERVIRYTELEVELEEKIAELALTQAELARLDGTKTGSIASTENLIKLGKIQQQNHLTEAETIDRYRTPNKLSFCFADGLVVVGDRNLDREKSHLDLHQSRWVEKLRSLYGEMYEDIHLKVLPLDKARKYIGARIVEEALEHDFEYEIDEYLSNYNSRQRSPTYEIGCFFGLRLYFNALGNESYSIWLANYSEWRLKFRKTPQLMFEQLESAVNNLLLTPGRDRDYLTGLEIKLDGLQARREEAQTEVVKLEALVNQLEAEKVELQSILNIE